MSSPNDTNVRVRFTANTGQIKQMFGQINKLTAVVKKLGKASTKLGSDMKKLGSRFDSAQGKSKKLAKTFVSQTAKQDRTRASLQRLRSGTKGYTNTMRNATTATKNTGTSLGFTGLAFGFIGGIAGFAANQIRTKFIAVLEETASLMSEISRINLFSDVGIANGVVNLAALETQSKKVFDLARETGILTKDIATIVKEVEKAAPASLNVDEFAKMVVQMKLLENTLDATTISADIITIQSNFEDMDLTDLIDQIFAFGKANKLNFSASAKALGFVSQGAKFLGSNLQEISRVITVVSNKIPGFQGNAGRAARRLTTAFSNPKAIQFLDSLGVKLVDDTGRFIGFENAIGLTADKFKEFNAENQLKAASFLKELGLTENARLALLAYADANEEVKEAVRGQFTPEAVKGQFQIAADFQKTQPEAVLGKFQNQITELKVEFTRGLFPAINQINEAMKDTFASGEVSRVLSELGRVIGQELVTAANVFLPIIKTISGFLASNKPIVEALAKAFVALFAALSAITVVFPMLGFFFALIFLHEKLIARSLVLGARATFVSRAYAGLWATIGRLNIRFKAWLVNLKAGNLSMGILSKSGIRGLRASLVRLGIGIKVNILAWKLFTITALRAAAATLIAWSAAILPIVIAVAALVLGIVLAKKYKDNLLEVANALDSTGTAASNLEGNIDGAFDIITTGDLTPAFDQAKKDLAGLSAVIGRIGDAFSVLFSDLENSKAAQLIGNAFARIGLIADIIKLKVGEFIESLSFIIPNVWGFLAQRWERLKDSLGLLRLSVIGFAGVLGFDIPAVWAELNTMWTNFTTRMDEMLLPLKVFLGLLDFQLPEPLKELQGVIEGITRAWEAFIKVVAKDPIIAAGLEILGIFTNFGDNIDKAVNDQPLEPFLIPQPGTSGFVGPTAPVPQIDLSQESLITATQAVFGYQEQIEATRLEIEKLNETFIDLRVAPFPEIEVPIIDPIEVPVIVTFPQFNVPSPPPIILESPPEILITSKIAPIPAIELPVLPTLIFPVAPVENPEFIGPIQPPIIPSLVLPPIPVPIIDPIVLTIEPPIVPLIPDIMVNVTFAPIPDLILPDAPTLLIDVVSPIIPTFVVDPITLTIEPPVLPTIPDIPDIIVNIAKFAPFDIPEVFAIEFPAPIVPGIVLPPIQVPEIIIPVPKIPTLPPLEIPSIIIPEFPLIIFPPIDAPEVIIVPQIVIPKIPSIPVTFEDFELPSIIFPPIVVPQLVGTIQAPEIPPIVLTIEPPIIPVIDIPALSPLELLISLPEIPEIVIPALEALVLAFETPILPTIELPVLSPIQLEIAAITIPTFEVPSPEPIILRFAELLPIELPTIPSIIIPIEPFDIPTIDPISFKVVPIVQEIVLPALSALTLAIEVPEIPEIVFPTIDPVHFEVVPVVQDIIIPALESLTLAINAPAIPIIDIPQLEPIMLEFVVPTIPEIILPALQALTLAIEPLEIPEIVIPDIDPVSFEVIPIVQKIVIPALESLTLAIKAPVIPEIVIPDITLPFIPEIIIPVAVAEIPPFVIPVIDPITFEIVADIPKIVIPNIPALLLSIIPPEIPEINIPIMVAEIPPIEAPELAPIILTIEPTIIPTIDSILTEMARKLSEFVIPEAAATTGAGGLDKSQQAVVQEGLAAVTDINGLFGIPPEFVSAMPALLEDVKTKYEESVEFLDVINPLYEELGKTVSFNVTIISQNSSTVTGHTRIIRKLMENLGRQIIEVIKNFNIISVMTTIIANVNLMFANLIAQGNRAAGKLASLKVSTTGKFSITDPGVSAADQKRIDDAASNLASTLENQVKVDVPTLEELIPKEESLDIAPIVTPDVLAELLAAIQAAAIPIGTSATAPASGNTISNAITINPVITINNAEGLDEAAIVALINAEFEATLQKNISSILTV